MYEKKYTKNRQIGRYIALIWILNVVYCEGKRKTHLKGISFFSHLAGGRGFPGRPVFYVRVRCISKEK